MTSKFKWINSPQAPADIRGTHSTNLYAQYSTQGPLTGQHVYVKTGYTVVLPNPGAGDDLAAFLGLWVAINQGTITSLKVPIDLISPSSSYANNETYITNERVSIDIAGTLIDTTTDGDGVAAVTEDGWWTATIKDTDRWRNYYIGGGNNVYISETNGPNGLIALPNYSGIQFTFGITIPQKTNEVGLAAYAKLPFSIIGFYPMTKIRTYPHRSNQEVKYVQGNSWDASWHEKYALTSQYSKKLLTNLRAHGTFDGDRTLKFKTK
jgi:hypothetical protein